MRFTHRDIVYPDADYRSVDVGIPTILMDGGAVEGAAAALKRNVFNRKLGRAVYAIPDLSAANIRAGSAGWILAVA